MPVHADGRLSSGAVALAQANSGELCATVTFL